MEHFPHINALPDFNTSIKLLDQSSISGHLKTKATSPCLYHQSWGITFFEIVVLFQPQEL